MTPHISSNKEDIAKTVIMPGDPKRAKLIADTFLENPKLINDVRGMTAYTGYYKDKKVTVMPSGMGMPSMGIYAYELFTFYDVEKIIRVGTCGALRKDIKINNIILASSAWTSSNFAYSYAKESINEITSDSFFNSKIKEIAKNLDINILEGKICTSDLFYKEYKDEEETDALAVEMETFALFYLGKKLNKQTASILTVSDNIITKESLSPLERETKLKDAIEIALNSL